MDANITISLEEFPDLGGTMSREIVGDNMNFLCRYLTGNNLQRAKASRADNIQNRAALPALGSRAIPDPTYPVLEWRFSESTQNTAALTGGL